MEGEIKMRRGGGGGLVLVGGGFYLCQICVGHFFFLFCFSPFFCSILGCRFVSVDDVGVEEGVIVQYITNSNIGTDIYPAAEIIYGVLGFIIRQKAH